MKRVVLVVMVLLFSLFLFSCDKESITESETLYETQATEGEDGEINEDPDA